MSDPIVAMARERIERGSKSFAGAARLFAPATRDSAFLLYAWCRHCDDEIDGQVLGNARQTRQRPQAEILAELRAKTEAATRGVATEPIYIALARVVEAHSIPAHHPLELIRGMEMDVDMETSGWRCATLEDTLTYSYHVAGVVGVMMARIMGASERPVLERASDLGIAFQLTNIARDVVPDADVGRIYLPSDWLDAARIKASDISDPARRADVFSVTNRLLSEADRYYASAQAGLPHLPFRSAWAVAAARRVYRDIGGIVRQRGARAWDQRASTSKARKLAGVALASADALWARGVFGATVHTPRQHLWTPRL